MRCGQGGAVHLAADRDGERLEHHHVGGHQVRRRAACQALAHCPGLQAGTARRHHVRHEARVLVPTLHADHCPGHAGDLVQQRLHLGGLHALTADLHLVICAAQQQVAHAGLPAGEVARAVQAPTRCEGIGDEARGCFDRTGPVAAGELRAAQVDLSRLTVRHGLQIGVQQVGGEAGQGPPNRGGLPGHRRRHGVHRGLGGPVEVPRELPRGHDVVPQGCGQRLAAQDQRGGRGQLQQAELHKHPGQRRRGVQHIDPVLRERVQEREGVPGHGGVVDVDRVSAEQPGELVDRGVEREGRGVRHVQVRGLRVLLGRREEQRAVVGDQVAERRPGHLHALGAPGCPGGVQQIGEVLRPGGVRGLGRGGVPADLLPQDPAGTRAQGGVAVRIREDDVRAAVLGGRTTPLGGVRAVQRLERAAREQGGEHAQDHLVAARQVQHHDVLGPHPRLRQTSREHAGPVHELCAGEGGAGVHEHGLVRAVELDLRDGLREVHGSEGLADLRGTGRRTPTTLERLPFLTRQRGHRPQAGRVLSEEPAQQRDEPAQPGERAVTSHPARVRLEAQLDLGTLPGGQRRDRETHVLWRASGHVAQQPGDAVEVQRGVEDLHVGAHPVQQATGAGHPEGAGQVLTAEALVLAHAHHGCEDLRSEVRGGVLGGDLHAQGQHIDRHGRGLQRGRGGAHHHRQGHDDVAAPGQPVHVPRVRAEQHVHPVAASARAQALQAIAVLRGERLRDVHGAPAGMLLTALSAADRGQRGHGVHPVALVLRALLALPVLAVLGHQISQRPVAGRGRGIAGGHGAVEGSDPAAQPCRRVPVDHEVVVELHEPHVLVRQAQDRVPEQLPLHHRRATQGHVRALLVHDRRGEREGIWCGPQVTNLGPVSRPVRDTLLRGAVVFTHAQPQGLGLRDGFGNRVRQPLRVDIPRADLHDLPHHVVRGRRIEPLGVPDPLLRAGERKPLRGVREARRGRHARLGSFRGRAGTTRIRVAYP